MKLLLDQGLPRGTVNVLGNTGLDTVHVGDIGYASATDEQILTLAREQRRTVITLDADFHAILAIHSAADPSVVRIRIEVLKSQDLASIIQEVIRQAHDELQSGALVTVEVGRIRIRRLPVI